MLRTIAITLAFLVLTASAFGDGWHIETVDSAGVVGMYTSIALDHRVNPHISYFGASEAVLKYAYYDGSSWHKETVDADGVVGKYTSIALDPWGDPHISYFDVTNYDLKYAYYEDWWHKETVDNAGKMGTSIALDSGNNPHISYYVAGGLKYAYYGGSSWHKEYVDTMGNVGMYTSIALDSGNKPHISYFNASEECLKYAYHDGSSWHKEYVDFAEVGWYTSIALDSEGNPHISYHDYLHNDLKYAYHVNSWHKEAVDTAGDVGEHTSIALDSGDNPHISYFDNSNNDLKYAYHDGSSWQIEAVDTAGDVGDYTSIALDSVGDPHISYYDDTNSGLKYAWYNTAPAAFDLLRPGDGDTVHWPIFLDWEDADDGQQVTYDLWYSENTDFNLHTEVVGLTESTYSLGGLFPGKSYYWKVRASDGHAETWSGPNDYWSFTANWFGGDNLPATFALHPAVPNPSDGSASIGFSLPRACEVELVLYDIRGRKVATLAEGTHQPGEHSATASGLSSGVYIYELTTDGFNDSKKMVVK